MNIPSVLIIYTTKTGNTKNIAEFVAEGIRFSGFQAKIKLLEEVADPEELEKYDAIVLGSSTYAGKMMEEMEQFLEIVKTLKLQGKAGGTFGAYGWSGEAADDIYKVLQKELEMKLPVDALRLKGAEIQGGMKMAQDYGRAIAQLVEK